MPVAAHWTPSSWRSKEVQQPVQYPEQTAVKLDAALDKLKQLPPLVTSHEIEKLRAQLQVARHSQSPWTMQEADIGLNWTLLLLAVPT